MRQAESKPYEIDDPVFLLVAAAFVTDGALYEIKASAESPEEISALIEALLTES